MYYKECSHCGIITEQDEQNCPSCYKNPFNEKRYSQKEIINKIKKGEIPIFRLKVKCWSPFIP